MAKFGDISLLFLIPGKATTSENDVVDNLFLHVDHNDAAELTEPKICQVSRISI